jgi:plasmid stability protein
MAEVRVRNLEEWVVDAYRGRAKRHGRSLEGELRQMLRDEIANSRKRLVAELAEGLREMEAKYGVLPDSAKGIREERDARG